MKWRNLLLGSAFIGAFSLGAMFAPISDSKATPNNGSGLNNLPVVQTENENNINQSTAVNYTCPMTGVQMGQGAGMGRYFSGNMSDIIANSLGMTVDELQTARIEGESIASIAKEKGVTIDELVDKMIQARTADLEKLVKSGEITQAQMDIMMENMKTMMKTAIERDTVGPMNDRGGMGQGQRYHGIGNKSL